MHKLLPAFLIVLSALTMQSAWAQAKIGVVDSDRVMRESIPAIRAQERLEKEFKQRERELERLSKELKNMEDEIQRNSLTMSETDMRSKRRALADLTRDFQRKEREFREDLNLRRNEELALVIERANVAIKQVAETEQYDIIFQEAVYASPKIDITDRVIKILSASK